MAATDVVRPVMWRFSPPTRFGERYAVDLTESPVEVFLGANPMPAPCTDPMDPTTCG